jgi:hypothetical protein
VRGGSTSFSTRTVGASSGGGAGVTLVWAVPVIAAALAMAWLVTWARPLEDEAAGLAVEVRELRRLRSPLAGIRRATADTDALIEDFREAHPSDDQEPPGDSE